MNAQEYVDRYFGPCVDFVKKHGYADWDGSANGQTITLTGCANMMAEMLRCRDEEASQPKPEPSVAPENISISIVSEAKGIVPKGAVYISKEHFNRLCQLAAKHKYGRCDCFDSAPPVAQHETLAPAQQETLAAAELDLISVPRKVLVDLANRATAPAGVTADVGLAAQGLRFLDQMDQAGFVGCYEVREYMRQYFEKVLAAAKGGSL